MAKKRSNKNDVRPMLDPNVRPIEIPERVRIAKFEEKGYSFGCSLTRKEFIKAMEASNRANESRFKGRSREVAEAILRG